MALLSEQEFREFVEQVERTPAPKAAVEGVRRGQAMVASMRAFGHVPLRLYRKRLPE